MQKNNELVGGRWQRILSITLVALLIAALLPFVSPLQRAGAAELTGEATLTIIFGQDMSGVDDVKVNVKYKFVEGATAEDLLNAAVASGDLEGYALDGNGFPQFFSAGGTTLTNATDMKTYWATFVDGTYYGGTDDITSMALVNGSSYQFAWDSYLRTVVPDWDTVGAAYDATSTVVGGDTATGTATLLVSFGYESYGGFLSADPSQWYSVNCEYSFAEGATVEDLFNAAVEGSNADYITYAGDWFFEGYELNDSGHLASASDMIFGEYKNASDWSTYWSFYVNGTYYDGNDNLTTIPLVDGTSYQFAWASYPSAVPPTSETFTAISAGAPLGTGIAGVSKPTEPTTIVEAEYNSFLASLTDSFIGTSDPWAAMSLAALGKTMPESANYQALLEDALNAFTTPGTTNIQRSIIALTALGLDATEVPYPESSSQSGTFNLIDRLLNSTIATSMVNGQAFAILALSCGASANTADNQDMSVLALGSNGYEVPAGTLEDLVDALVANQLPDGGFAWNATSGNEDADMTAMAITALASQKGNTTAEEALQKALIALQLYQLDDGSWGSYDSIAGEVVTNVNSTAMAVIALSAVGIDPASQWVREGGATPLSALMGFATADGTSFTGNAMAIEQGFRALAAYEGFRSTGAAYNIYLQAGEFTNPSNLGTATTPSGSTNTIPATGDTTLPLLVVMLCAAVSSLGVAIAVRRRHLALYN